MADPIVEDPTRLTPLSYAVDDHELEIMIALIQSTGCGTMAAVMDCALWKLAEWYGIPMSPDAFDLGKRARRHARRER